jgi:hypothetical protein
LVGTKIECQELAEELRAIKAKFHAADYYRFFPELSGPERFKRIGDATPREMKPD